MAADFRAERPARDALTAFRAVVLADVALQHALGEIENDAKFVALAVQAARAHGLDLDAEALRAALRASTPGPVLQGLAPLPGWLPAEVTRVDGRDLVGWLHFGQQRLTEPFYDGALARARFRPLNRLLGLRTPLAALPTWAAALVAPPLHGLIFHMSRCGSTLAAQMLAASPSHVVISEAAPINAVVGLEDQDKATRVAVLRAMVSALTQARNPGETRAFVKLDCWHTRDLPLFREAFPDTPWIFLYRDPVEVLVSHLRRRGMQMVPVLVPPAVFGLDLQDGVPSEDYCARVLAAVCEGAVRHYPVGGGLLVDYEHMPRALLETILPHFGVTASTAEIAIMRQATARDAKAPEQAFSPDGAAKQQAATPAIRAICEHRVGDMHRRLEALRAAQA